MENSNYVREPIALFRQIEEKKKSSNLLHNLKSACPKNLNIGIAIKTGDCFFDSVAQGLNELNIKPDHYFTAKSKVRPEKASMFSRSQTYRDKSRSTAIKLRKKDRFYGIMMYTNKFKGSMSKKGSNKIYSK